MKYLKLFESINDRENFDQYEDIMVIYTREGDTLEFKKNDMFNKFDAVYDESSGGYMPVNVEYINYINVSQLSNGYALKYWSDDSYDDIMVLVVEQSTGLEAIMPMPSSLDFQFTYQNMFSPSVLDSILSLGVSDIAICLGNDMNDSIIGVKTYTEIVKLPTTMVQDISTINPDQTCEVDLSNVIICNNLKSCRIRNDVGDLTNVEVAIGVITNFPNPYSANILVTYKLDGSQDGIIINDNYIDVTEICKYVTIGETNLGSSQNSTVIGLFWTLVRKENNNLIPIKTTTEIEY